MITNSLQEELAKQEDEQIRSNIERIISSYRHIWDIYTELLQNSADAILDKFGANNIDQGIIKLEIEPNQRKIIITDNGIGINETDMSRILVTGKSLKRERNSGKYGFMGYGFTFVAFQSEYLRIECIKNGLRASRTYRNLYQFAFSDIGIPNSQEEANNQSPTSVNESDLTRIEIIFPMSFPEVTVEQALAAAFRLPLNRTAFAAVLRTRSIIGTLDPIFDSSDTFSFELYIDGENFDLPVKYLTTREVVRTVLYDNENQFYDRESQYEGIITATDSIPRSAQDQARRAILLEEKISELTVGTRNSVPTRVLITATSKDHINEYNKKFTNEKDGFTDFELEHGIWLAICGMPTGVCIDPFDHPTYLPYSVIVDITDPLIRKELDAGRKGISTYRMNQVAETIRKTLADRNFLKYRRYVVGAGDSRISNPLYDPKEALRKILVDKEEFISPLIHRFLPPMEEQEVISLLIELIARNILKGYIPKVLSGYQVYDGLFDYKLAYSPDAEYSQDNKLGIHVKVFRENGNSLDKEVLVEFKKNLNGIYRDIQVNKKDFSNVDILVCWDVDFAHRQAYLEQHGDILREADVTANVYYGVTHVLIGANRQQPLPIIELQKVLNYKYAYNSDNESL